MARKAKPAPACRPGTPVSRIDWPRVYADTAKLVEAMRRDPKVMSSVAFSCVLADIHLGITPLLPETP